MKKIFNTKKRTIKDINKALINKEYTALDIVNSYFDNIEQKNKELNVFLTLTKELAISKANELDKKINSGEKINLLSGVPYALKDNFNFKGYRTTASSKILEEYISPYNSTVASRLIESEAIVMGKTNLDAFAHGSSTETSDFGTSKNPYNTNHSPGGSSGGSAAAVAADLSVFSIGSETAGSVRGPASWCGVYGFVPTYGRFSRYGLIAMGSSLDRPGILANTVEDLAIVADALAGKDEKDATSINIPRGKCNYYNILNNKNTRLTIGIPKQFKDERIDIETRDYVDNVLKEYEKLGAKILEIDLMDPKYAMAVYTILCRSEVSSNLARIDGIRYGYNSEKIAENIIEQISLNRGEGFGNEAKQRSMTGAYTLSSGFYDAYYTKALKVRTLIINDFKRAFNEVDIIAGATMPGPAAIIGSSKDNPLFGELSDILAEPSSLAGLPCINIPIGFNKEGLPLGMQLIGPQLKDDLVLNTAYIFESIINK